MMNMCLLVLSTAVPRGSIALPFPADVCPISACCELRGGSCGRGALVKTAAECKCVCELVPGTSTDIWDAAVYAHEGPAPES